MPVFIVTSLMAIATSDAELLIEHLQLSPRTENALRRKGVRTIKDFCSASFDGSYGLQRSSLQEVARTRRWLETNTADDGHVDWDSYRATLPASTRNVTFTSKALASLSESDRSRSISILHIDKSFNLLKSRGIDNIGHFIDAAREDTIKLSSWSAAARTELTKCLNSLSLSVGADGAIDWPTFAAAMGVRTIPSLLTDTRGRRTLLASLRSSMEDAILCEFDKRYWNVFEKRLLSSLKPPTLDEIGSFFGLARETVRQIEESCIQTLRRSLLHEDYSGLGFRFRSEVGQPLREAATRLVHVALPIWTRKHWLEELAQCWSTTTTEVLPYLALLTEFLSYKEVRLEVQPLESLFMRSSTSEREVRRIREAVISIHEALHDVPLAIDEFEVAQRIKTRLPSDIRIVLGDIPELVKLCSSVEIVDGKAYRCRFEHISRSAQIVRVLTEYGKPLHYTALLRELNKRRPAKGDAVTKAAIDRQLATDDRVVAIGRSGQWALAQWGTETRSIVSIIEDVFHRTGEAMTESRIYEAVASMRQASAKSVPMLLQDNPKKFRKVGPRMWALTAWGDSDVKTWNKEDIGIFVSEFFRQRGCDSVQFSDLREAFMRASGLSDRSARGVLVAHPAVSVERPDARERIAVFQPKWRASLRVHPETGKRQRSAIMENIRATVDAKLAASPTRERLLNELVKEVEAELNVPRPTVYAVVKQSSEFETVAVQGSASKTCRLRGSPTLQRRKHTILFLAANPLGTERIALDQEARAIQIELERSWHRDRFELVTRWAVEPLDLLRELRKLRPTLVHFSGHGAPSTPGEYRFDETAHRDVVGEVDREDEESQHGLYFHSSDGRPQRVSAKALQDAFGAAGSSVQVVVLSACYSATQAEGLLAHVDCVVGMRHTIRDDAARAFAIGFYGGLGERASIKAAFRQGCAAISLEGLPEVDRPHLAVRVGIDEEQLVLAADLSANHPGDDYRD